MFVLGTDEAGYGPTLGPLVVAATLWHAENEDESTAGFAELAAGVPWNETEWLRISDSKELYERHAKQPLRKLEAALQWLLPAGSEPTSMGELLESLGVVFATPLGNYRGANDWLTARYPLTLSSLEQQQLKSVREQWLKADKPICLRTRVIILEPRAFNAQCSETFNKSDLLSLTTISLARELWQEAVAPADCELISDRHGGRQFYGALLQQLWPDHRMQVESELAQCSRYRLTQGSSELRWRFLVGGEANPPVAAASIIAKYLRERWMEAFNRRWQELVPGLSPTAGYPVDARRFLSAIEVQRKALGIDAIELVRSR
jgi:ribonuclease HII